MICRYTVVIYSIDLHICGTSRNALERFSFKAPCARPQAALNPVMEFCIEDLEIS